jgi:hypothetical protein
LRRAGYGGHFSDQAGRVRSGWRAVRVCRARQNLGKGIVRQYLDSPVVDALRDFAE